MAAIFVFVDGHRFRPVIGRRVLPGGPADSSFRTSCCVSMLKSPMWPLAKDVTMWAGSLLTRSTEVGTPSSDTHTGANVLNIT